MTGSAAGNLHGQGVLSGLNPTQLVTFEVTGEWVAADNPTLSGNTNTLAVDNMTAVLVTFTPRLPRGHTAYVSNYNNGASTAIEIPTIAAQIYQGTLCTLNYIDTPGIQLVANTGQLNLGCDDLIYDAKFTNVSAGAAGCLAPFAFVAPTDSSGVCLTDPALERLPYAAPPNTEWAPPPIPGQPIPVSRHWRQRALYRSLGA